MGLIPGYDADNKLDLYADGLTVYTTLDSRMQEYAEKAVQKHMKVIQQRFDNHWGNMPPWRDRQHNEIPNFIENIAKRTTHYKYLKERFPDSPDSVDYYLNLPHPVKVFSYDDGLHTLYGEVYALRIRGHRTRYARGEGLGGRH